MKPTTEIIESLRRCSSTYCVGTCENCHYFKVPNCASELRLDAADALEAQGKEIADLKRQLEGRQKSYRIEVSIDEAEDWLEKERLKDLSRQKASISS